ncbi:MAG TPA: hypothetical protein VLZ77_01455, partial [Acidimicrobiales bacterium]|nr:hypothetical protein [Acidimicrobiales bacterium]
MAGNPLLAWVGGRAAPATASLPKAPADQPGRDAGPAAAGEAVPGWQNGMAMVGGAPEAHSSAAGAGHHGTGAAELHVGIGRRVAVVANLGLRPAATASSTWAADGLARILDRWDGPGVVVVAGNLVDLRGCSDIGAATTAALDAHPRLSGALEAFVAGDDRRVVVIPGDGDGALAAEPDALVRRGIEVAPAVDLSLSTAAGTRLVRVEGRRTGDA